MATIRGTNGHDRGTRILIGTKGSDSIFGLNGDDEIWNTTQHLPGGADDIFGGSGHDFIDGGRGNDYVLLDYERVSKPYSFRVVNVENVHFQGGHLNDRVTLNGSRDTLEGNNGNDTLNAGSKDDLLYGGDGRDSLNGGSGHDLVYGQRGNDTLVGGDGNDTLIGGQGADDMRNDGGGRDIFLYHSVFDSTTDSMDRIGLDPGVDKVDLSHIDSNLSRSGDQAFTFIGNRSFGGSGTSNGQVRFNSNNLIEVDLGNDGDLRADLVIQSTRSLNGLSASDFIL